MNDYHQPDFYRFNEDSLKLVEHVLARVGHAEAVLDLGSGSGVMGIELSRSLKPRFLTLIEVQKEFLPYLEQNVSFAPFVTNCRIILESFSGYKEIQKYDLIVCNPPYYLPGHGERPKNRHREIARSFVLDDWGILLNCINEAMSDKGVAYLVLKNEKQILGHIKHPKLKSEMVLQHDLAFIKLSRLKENRGEELL